MSWAALPLRGEAVVGPLEAAVKTADWPYPFRAVVKSCRGCGGVGSGGAGGMDCRMALRDIARTLNLPESALRRNEWYGWHLVITDGKRARALQLGAESVAEGELREGGEGLRGDRVGGGGTLFGVEE